MTAKATISFSQPGVQPPVYVVTPLSNPPWETLELTVDDEKMPSGDLVFTRHFNDVGEGSYQYKIRIGEGYWVLDESKETATDEQGNRNNVIHAKGPPPNIRKDSTTDASALSQLPSSPVPFVVVEKAADQEQPDVGDAEPQKLPVDADKRAADAEPDFEETKASSPVDADPPELPEVPLLVVEKTDNEPTYGDDFGDDATTAQKVAHEMRAADASPDKLVITPEDHVEPSTKEEESAPLFEHETYQTGEQLPESPSMETPDEESVQSSTDQTSSSGIVHTPSEADESQEDNEFSHAPLLPHETGLGNRASEFDRVPLLSHEMEDGTDEFSNGPLLSHETGFKNDSAIHSDDGDELAKSPLLSHETGFPQSKGSDIVTEYSEEDLEPQPYTRFDDSHEEENGVPLLPHERDMRAASISGSERSMDDGLFLPNAQPSFGYETSNARGLFGGGGRSSIFRTGTDSSSLPHKLPKSDEEDDNLHDASLEPFPTSREQILERVATIGHHLPEDQVVDEQHSPQMSVMSQACSSVDLRQINSYASLPSVLEEGDDDEYEAAGDFGSPVMMGGRHTRVPNSFFGFARDPNATPVSEDNRRLELVEEVEADEPNTHTAESSEASSLGKNDGAKDLPTPLAKLVDSAATPAKVLNSLIAPLTPKVGSTSTDKETSESEPRQRRELEKDSANVTTTPSAPSEDTKNSIKDKVARIVSPDALQRLDRPHKSFLQNLLRVVFRPAR
ncbi:hypothetical protein P153DRAFT_298733 [Dothidotthia symphoricarpi CBS 119687]|uniref:AMP-activated protein kinase glycogen-binding domain-containing protein n=1 Tax=Dothidotthia symphoricarpi CBS 119687 TaxID=1392245 RepID=A0A6A6A4I5_9PLEO|nr:uncharacterized protein P153DRAFT_298733 [Dothidotthia symphoricarpi CBS 119687]KAF2126034.1 hypothetical protein P153DRAFT_298733 [Dothidotthia symphoricarpi CBS 119687]